MRRAHGRKGVGPVNRNYDLFEMLPDGSPRWKGSVSGYDDAIRMLHKLSERTANKVHLMYLPTKTIIATLNAPTVMDGAR
jgi:hypothetical protein